jgi:hypothetical protein
MTAAAKAAEKPAAKQPVTKKATDGKEQEEVTQTIA